MSRRRFLTASAAAAAGVGFRGGDATASRSPVLTTRSVVATRRGEYLYVPFEVPGGATRIDVAVRRHDGDAKTGVGLFDHRGVGYQTPGFRGVYGEERTDFFLTTTHASDAFIAGPIRPGDWTVVIPVFTVTIPTRVEVQFKVSFDPQPPPLVGTAGPVVGPEQGVVRDEPGWYRGDLHCHTIHSSDAWKTPSAHQLTPRRWAELCRDHGLDFVALTDHNVVTQNFHLARDADGTGVLLMPGEEMTNWFHGHATVSGLAAPDAWLDWRQRPEGVPLQDAHTEARIAEFIRAANEQGAFVSAAHPMFAHLSWQFLAEMQADPAARTHGFEVWTGQWQPDDEASLAAWDGMLRRGIRIVANGGSDLHRTAPEDTYGFEFGTPTTVVHAERLSKAAIVAAVKAGRSFVTRRPRGHEVRLWARASSEEAWRTMGDTVRGEPGSTIELRADVRLGNPAQAPATETLRLVLWSDGRPHRVVRLDPGEPEQSVTDSVVVAPGGGYVRAEVRDRAVPASHSATAGRLDMEAFTNPIWVQTGG